MKRVILFAIGCVFYNMTVAQVLWDGEGGDGQWANAANWVGDVIPGATDDVVLDNLGGAPGSFVVTLPDAGVTVRSLRISPAGMNTIRLRLPSTNTLSSNAFVTTGSGYTLVLDQNASFENNSGAPSGTNLTIADSIWIANGAAYIHRTRCAHLAIAQRISRSAGTEKGVFVFDVPAASYTVSFAGRTYGSLTFSSAAYGSRVSYSGGGATALNIRGDLTVDTNTTVGLTMSANAIVHGDCLVKNGAVFNLQNSSNSNIVRLRRDLLMEGTITRTGSGLPTLVFDGNVLQSVSVTGVLTDSIAWELNNPVGMVLLSPVTLPYHLVLVNGKITTTATNLLTIAAGMTCTGGSGQSFIDGPMRKNGAEAFVFPIGEGNEYAPVEVSAGGDPTDGFIAQYFRGNPRTVYGMNYENPPIHHMSVLEWWTIDRAAGTASKTVTLCARAYSEATLLAELRVLRWDGALWRNEGNSHSPGIAVGPVSSGVITDFFPAGTPTPFTFGSMTGNNNPLPVTIVGFQVMRLGYERLRLSWELATPGPGSMIEVQRAGDDRRFVTIASVPVDDTARHYDWTDNHVLPGNSFYRLRLIPAHGATLYSKVISLPAQPGSLQSGSLTMSSTTMVVELSSPIDQPLDVAVYDPLGRVMYRRQQSLVSGLTRMELPVGQLAAGTYTLCLAGRTDRLIRRFMKK